MASWNPYDQNSVAGFFDPEWMFDIKEGFDIVIGNPPYIQLQKFTSINPELQTAYANAGYKSHTATGDIYCLFYEMGHAVLRWRTGILAYVTSNKWMRAGYGKNLRDFFEREVDPLLLIDFAGQRVFTTATVDVNILIFRKSKSDLMTKACTIEENCLNVLGEYVRQNANNIPFRSSAPWVISLPIEDQILEKIEDRGTPLAEWDVNILYGIKTGYNDAFLVDNNTKMHLIREDSNSAKILKPVLRGRDIKRYHAEFADLWLIDSNNGYVNSKGIKSLPVNINHYPAVKKWLDSHWQKISARGDKGDTPYNLRECAYYQEFMKEIVVWKAVGKNMTFALWGHDKFIIAPASFISSKNNKYLLAFLQSNYGKYFFYKYADKTGAGDIMLNIQSLKKLPVPIPSPTEKETIKRIVNEIISLIDLSKTIDNSNYKNQINKLDSELNHYIYSMFNFSDKERLFIESSII